MEYRDGLGSAVVHSAVSSGAIDIAIDYTGTLWTNQMKRQDNPGREAMYEAIVAWQRETSDAQIFGRLGFENAYGLAMRGDVARRQGFTSIADLAGQAPGLAIGGDPEWFERPEWSAVRRAYGLRFGEERTFSPTFMYNALRSGDADVISAYTSDGRIAADNLIILTDSKNALPSYDALIVLSPRARRNERLKAVLKPVLGAITVEAMRDANYAVDRDDNKSSPAEAAAMLAKRAGL